MKDIEFVWAVVSDDGQTDTVHCKTINEVVDVVKDAQPVAIIRIGKAWGLPTEYGETTIIDQ